MSEVSIEYEGQVLIRTDEQAGTLELQYKGMTSIARIKGLEKLVHLHTLVLSSNKIEKIEGLEKLVNLHTLVLSSNKIERIEGLEQLVNLHTLVLSSNKIERIEGLEQLVNLRNLDLSDNNIQKIEGLEQLANLSALRLNQNRIQRIEGLDRLVDLKQLWLLYNRIQRIEGLEHLVALKGLMLGDNRIRRIEGLESLAALEDLDLGNNKIKRIEGLDHLVILRVLDLKANQIRQCEGLEHLDKLERLYIKSNPIKPEEWAWKEKVKYEIDVGKEKEKNDRVSNWILVDFWLIPQIIATILFSLLGFLYAPYVPPSHVTLFWCVLLIGGNVGNALAVFFCTSTSGKTKGEGADFLGALLGTIIPNAFVYGGELVWFLVVSVDLLGVIGMLILIQFLVTYCTSVIFTTGSITLDITGSRKKPSLPSPDSLPRPTECPDCHVPLKSKRRCKQCGKAWCLICGTWNEAGLERCKKCQFVLPSD
jgi:Leucine-rich repeat (LRR) protein